MYVGFTHTTPAQAATMAVAGRKSRKPSWSTNILTMGCCRTMVWMKNESCPVSSPNSCNLHRNTAKTKLTQASSAELPRQRVLRTVEIFRYIKTWIVLRKPSSDSWCFLLHLLFLPSPSDIIISLMVQGKTYTNVKILQLSSKLKLSFKAEGNAHNHCSRQDSWAGTGQIEIKKILQSWKFSSFLKLKKKWKLKTLPPTFAVPDVYVRHPLCTNTCRLWNRWFSMLWNPFGHKDFQDESKLLLAISSENGIGLQKSQHRKRTLCRTMNFTLVPIPDYQCLFLFQSEASTDVFGPNHSLIRNRKIEKKMSTLFISVYGGVISIIQVQCRYDSITTDLWYVEQCAVAV